MSNRYVIHACPERMWYVNDYLLPSLNSQGIHDIDIYCDWARLGNLNSCMRIFGCMGGEGSAWHLQDDVLVCGDFKERTEEYLDGGKIVCGFVWRISQDITITKPLTMGYSFPCICIPNKIARECAKWFYEKAVFDPKCLDWVSQGICDDEVFKEFLIQNYPDEDILHLKPSLVEHVDYLIGGSTVNPQKTIKTKAKYFNDKHLVERLENELRSKNRL